MTATFTKHEAEFLKHGLEILISNLEDLMGIKFAYRESTFTEAQDIKEIQELLEYLETMQKTT